MRMRNWVLALSPLLLPCLAGCPEPTDDDDSSDCVATPVDADEIDIPGGSFEMGAPSGDEFPAHSVTLSGFSIDKTEVTNGMYQVCVDAGCCTPPTFDGAYSGREPYFGASRYADYPVVYVTWEQASQFCESQGKRLPTEAEWEYAARGDDGRHFPWGSESPSLSLANYNLPRYADTREVGSYPDGASAFGALDMAGNVWEWVADWYSASYYSGSPDSDPTGPESGLVKVARGGSFASEETELYSFYRAYYLPSDAFSTVGFRCAR